MPLLAGVTILRYQTLRGRLFFIVYVTFLVFYLNNADKIQKIYDVAEGGADVYNFNPFNLLKKIYILRSILSYSFL